MKTDPAHRAAARRHAAVWMFAVLLVGSVGLPIGSYVYTGLTAQAQAAAEKQTNPRANYWRAVRDGSEGYSAVTGVRMDGTVINSETNVLVQNGGQIWREARNGPVASISPWFLAFVLAALVGLYLYRGAIQLDRKPSGRTIERYKLTERVIHWYTAVLFIILAITGLSLLFGRTVLIPVLGLGGFSAWANLSIYVHNWLGPFFIVGMVLSIVMWITDNIPSKTDWEWFKAGVGGILAKDKHPHAGRFNGGEKIFVFWVGLVILGIAVSLSGLYLIGWIGSGMRETMQVANLVHAIASVIWIGIICGHIYLGLATQGALEGMTSGQVSEEWAKQHHDLWHSEVSRKG